MRILVAPDKFKNSLSAREAAQQIAAGLRSALPQAAITLLPLADGGEGTASVIQSATGGEWMECETQDALGRRITAQYLWQKETSTAVLEMSAAAGMWRLLPGERDPLRASTVGVGEMVLEATRRGAAEIIVGLGGSATTDGGFGMARALGFRFRNARGEELRGPVPELLELERIDRPGSLRLQRITAAADARIPLLGAARLFAAQKGASPEQCAMLEKALGRLAQITARDVSAEFSEVAGAGAAGGLGFGLMSFCGAQMRSGFEVIADLVGLDAAIRAADIVITGEGRLDAQTLEGKTPAGVARMARAHGRKIYAVVGQIEEGAGVRELFDGVVALDIGGVSAALAQRSRELGGILQRDARSSRSSP